jgi:hypothetical protein
MNNLKNHLFYYFYIYLLIPVLVIAFVSYAVNKKTEYKNYEQIKIYIGSYGVLDDELHEFFSNNLDDSVLEISILDYNLTDPYFNTTLTSAGIVDTDIIIIPKEFMNDNFVQRYCAKLDKLDINGIETYSVSGSIYGIEIYNEEKNINYLDDYIEYVYEDKIDSYYLLVNKDTVNFNSIINTDNKNSSNNVYDLINIILSK